jgi:hypothetical protein
LAIEGAVDRRTLAAVPQRVAHNLEPGRFDPAVLGQFREDAIDHLRFESDAEFFRGPLEDLPGGAGGEPA